MTDEISVTEAARLLDTSSQTVRNYIRQGLLTARRSGARRFAVDRGSVEALLRNRPLPGRRRQPKTAPASPDVQNLARERDDLRARVVELQEAVLRLRTAAEYQRQADTERAMEVDRLMEALGAAQRAGSLQRLSAAELEEAVASIALPGHPGGLTEG